MGRQIQYDPTELRQSVLSVFWAQGFAETSLNDLEAATGLNRRQLYNGIGDKRTMFLGALDDFSEQAGRTFLAALEAPGAGRGQIEALLLRFVDLSRSGQGGKGCMVCNTSLEGVAADPQVRARLEAYFERIRAAYRHALTGAAARGEITLDPADLPDRAEVLFGAHVALCVLARAGHSPDGMERIARRTIADLR